MLQKKFGFGLWMIANKILIIISLLIFFSPIAISKNINKINFSHDPIISKNNGIILNKQNSLDFPVESIAIKENKILIKTYNAEYAPVTANKIGDNYYEIKNLFFLHAGGNLILPKGVDEKKLMVYKNGKYKLKLFTNGKGIIIYIVVYFENRINNNIYISEQKFIPSKTFLK